jgi:hypothetical protein
MPAQVIATGTPMISRAARGLWVLLTTFKTPSCFKLATGSDRLRETLRSLRLSQIPLAPNDVNHRINQQIQDC